MHADETGAPGYEHSHSHGFQTCPPLSWSLYRTEGGPGACTALNHARLQYRPAEKRVGGNRSPALLRSDRSTDPSAFGSPSRETASAVPAAIAQRKLRRAGPAVARQ